MADGGGSRQWDVRADPALARFWDDLGLVAPEDYVPNTVQTLLAHLHLEDAPRAEQESAIRAWLRGHPAGRAMTFTLERNGFGHLADGD